MTSKEALKCLQPFRWDDKKEIEAYEALKKLVERDTPMLPIKLKWNNTKIFYYVCPKCEEVVTNPDEVFCQDCGQRLDWS